MQAHEGHKSRLTGLRAGQDMSDSMFAETERAQALREVRSRDSRFDMVAFLRTLRRDVPTVVAAFLNGDVTVLREHCTPDLVTRLAAIIEAQRASVSTPFSRVIPTDIAGC